MGKYIIELERGETAYKTVNSNGKPMIQLLAPTPYTAYTEPDLEQVRKEAYEKGWKEAEDHYEKGYNDGYDTGLSHAWEAARTLWNTPNRKEIFGHTTFNIVLTTLTAQEAIEKIRQYEQEKEEIKVGDEVNAPFGKAIVVNIDSVAEKIWLVYADGHGGFEYFKDAPTKTGRHFPEIVEILQKMKGGEQDD